MKISLNAFFKRKENQTKQFKTFEISKTKDNKCFFVDSQIVRSSFVQRGISIVAVRKRYHWQTFFPYSRCEQKTLTASSMLLLKNDHYSLSLSNTQRERERERGTHTHTHTYWEGEREKVIIFSFLRKITVFDIKGGGRGDCFTR